MWATESTVLATGPGWGDALSWKMLLVLRRETGGAHERWPGNTAATWPEASQPGDEATLSRQPRRASCRGVARGTGEAGQESVLQPVWVPGEASAGQGFITSRITQNAAPSRKLPLMAIPSPINKL